MSPLRRVRCAPLAFPTETEFGRIEATASDPGVPQQYGMIVGKPDAGQLNALSTLNIRGERSVTWKGEFDRHPSLGPLPPGAPPICEVFRHYPDALERAAEPPSRNGEEVTDPRNTLGARQGIDERIMLRELLRRLDMLIMLENRLDALVRLHTPLPPGRIGGAHDALAGPSNLRAESMYGLQHPARRRRYSDVYTRRSCAAAGGGSQMRCNKDCKPKRRLTCPPNPISVPPFRCRRRSTRC